MCLSTTYFQVNGKYYKQNHGTAMGSPESVVVANLFMEELEETALHSSPHSVKTWKRHVDDNFDVIKHAPVHGLHEHLNQQATVEQERNGGLRFLDVEVKTSQKGFNSHHSRQHNESVVRSLVKRDKMFPSDKRERIREAKRLDGALRANNYPNRFVEKTRHKIRMREMGETARVTEKNRINPW